MYTVGAQFKFAIIGTNVNAQPCSLAFQWFLAVAATTLSFADVVDDLGEVAATLAEDMTPLQSELLSWHSYRLSELDGTFASGVLPIPGGPFAGALAQDPLPAQTALQLSCPTQQSRRILKKYIPGGTETQTGNLTGNWTSTVRAAWVAATAGWLTGIEATNGLWLWSYNDMKSTPVSIIFPHSLTVRTEPHVQRRRRQDA